MCPTPVRMAVRVLRGEGVDSSVLVHLAIKESPAKVCMIK